jgi:hypothetical protein
MLALITLLDVFLIVSEVYFQAYGIHCESAEQATGKPAPDRVAVRLISEFKSVLPEESAALFRSWRN